MTQIETKTCTTCKATKPVTDFYRNGNGKPGYRFECKDCDKARRKRGKTTRSRITYEIAMHYMDPSFPLSPEAEAVVYTTEPLSPALLAMVEKRKQLAEKGELRRNKQLRKLTETRPMKFGRYEAAA